MARTNIEILENVCLVHHVVLFSISLCTPEHFGQINNIELKLCYVVATGEKNTG